MRVGPNAKRHTRGCPDSSGAPCHSNAVDCVPISGGGEPSTLATALLWQGAPELSGRADSNRRPSGPKPDALPDCATPRCHHNLVDHAQKTTSSQPDPGDAVFWCTRQSTPRCGPATRLHFQAHHDVSPAHTCNTTSGTEFAQSTAGGPGMGPEEC